MANKKKRPLWMEEAAQKPTSGTPYANRRNEQEARNTSKQRAVQTVSKMTQRGTGSQTTNTGRGTANGVDILQRAQNALGVREPEPGSNGRIEHTLGAAGNSWLSGQLNMIGSVLGSGVETNSGAGLSAKVREKEIKEYREKMLGGLRDKSFAAADKRAEKAEKHEKAAKEGLGGFGKLVVDTGIAGSQMLMDAALGSVTGTGLLSMGTRTYGDSARQAREAGASWDQANRYGLGKAGVEVGTEKMFDAMRLFGGGSLDKTMEATLNKMAKTDAGRTALRLLGNIGGEGAEEAVSDLVDPILRQTYDSNAIRSSYGTAEGREEMRSQILYDALVGGILGGLGGAGSVVTGENARKNDALRTPEERDAAERPQRISEADAARARQDRLFGADAESVAAYQAQQNRPRTIAQGVEALQNAANAVNAQNATESPVTNGTPQEGNLSANTERTATENVTGQNQPQAADAAQNFAPEDHIDNRTDDYISKTSTKAFQHEHPELHDHFAGIAQRIMEEAMVSIDRGSTKVMRKAGGGTRTYYDAGLKKVIERSGLSRNQVIKVCQDIINDQGSENYADAKRVEQALDSLMSGSGEYADAEYKRKKGEITGGTQTGSFDEYLKENELVLALGMATKDELRAEWEALQQGQTAEAEQQSAAPTQADANGLPEGHGPMSPQFAYRETPTQTHGSDALYNEEERQTEGLRPEDSRHKVNSDAEVDRNANERLEFDYEGEKADLFENKQSWDDADTALAHRILEAEIAQARMTGDYSEVVRLQRVWEARGTEQGQALRQRGRFTHTAADIVGEAATALDDIGDKLPKKVDKAALLNDIANDAEALDRARNADTTEESNTAVIELIERLSSKRKTGGFLYGLIMPSRVMETTKWALQQAAKQGDGNTFLISLAESQLRSRATDFAPTSPLEVIKTARYMGMLSKIATVMRNVEGNAGFDLLETYSEDTGGMLADLFMSIFTKRRSMPFDRSWFSKAKRKGAGEASIRAYLETALDADVSGTKGKYETKAGGRTVKAVKSPVARFFSNMEKWTSYTLTVPDEFFKGGARAEHQRGIDSLKARGLLESDALEGAADETALQRTFQNNGRTAGVLMGVRKALDDNLAIHDSAGGSYGLGTQITPFAQVPANLGEQLLNYSPAGVFKSVAQVANVIRKGSNATAEEQQAAARALGRSLTGSEFVALAVYLTAKGIIHIAGLGGDDDDKDLYKLQQTEGISGVQINKSALMRALRGESTEWQEGDDLQSIGHLQPLNGQLAIGALLSEDLKDHNGITAKDLKNASLQAVLETYQDLPAFSSVSNIINNFHYSEADTVGDKMTEVGEKFVGDSVASLVPNWISGIAQGADEGRVRETYDSNASVAENTFNTIKSKIPGFRETLPQALDNWGEGRQTTATPLQNWFNTNVLPGAVTRYQTNEVNQELYRLMESQDVKPPARSAIKEVSDGDKTRKLDNEDQRTYQEVSGQTAFRELQRLMDSAQYGRMRDDERAAAWNAIMTYGKAQGEQWVGGGRETPSWATKSDGTTAENAAFYAILQAAKHRLDEDDRKKVAPVVEAIFNRRLDEDTQLGVLQQELNEKQIGRLQTAIGYGYEPKDIASFWGYMNSVNGRKNDTRSWALQNGFSAADFNVLWKVFH